MLMQHRGGTVWVNSFVADNSTEMRDVRTYFVIRSVFSQMWLLLKPGKRGCFLVMRSRSYSKKLVARYSCKEADKM